VNGDPSGLHRLTCATAYLKKVVEKLKEKGASEDEVKSFQTKVQGYFTKVIGPNFKDYDFYVGESMDTDGM
jgi:glutaredoxin 2